MKKPVLKPKKLEKKNLISQKRQFSRLAEMYQVGL